MSLEIWTLCSYVWSTQACRNIHLLYRIYLFRWESLLSLQSSSISSWLECCVCFVFACIDFPRPPLSLYRKKSMFPRPCSEFPAACWCICVSNLTYTCTNILVGVCVLQAGILSSTWLCWKHKTVVFCHLDLYSLIDRGAAVKSRACWVFYTQDCSKALILLSLMWSERKIPELTPFTDLGYSIYCFCLTFLF